MLSHSPVFGGMEQNPMIMVGGGGGLVRPMHVGSGLVSPIPNAANHLAPNMNSMGSPLPSAANQFSAVTQGTAVTTPGLYSPVMVFGSPPYTASNFSTFPGQSVAASAAAVSSLFNAPARSANQNMQPVGTPGLPHVERGAYILLFLFYWKLIRVLVVWRSIKLPLVCLCMHFL